MRYTNKFELNHVCSLNITQNPDFVESLINGRGNVVVLPVKHEIYITVMVSFVEDDMSP